MKLQTYQVLWSPYSASIHAMMCVSNPCTCTTFQAPNKPLVRLPTPEAQEVNANDLKLYMHLWTYMDTEGYNYQHSGCVSFDIQMFFQFCHETLILYSVFPLPLSWRGTAPRAPPDIQGVKKKNNNYNFFFKCNIYIYSTKLQVIYIYCHFSH